MTENKRFIRKILNGNGAAYINIPAELLKKMGWTYGDEVWMYPNSTGLFLSNPKVYTIGYEGMSIKKFLKILKDYKISQVIDVRDTPWSANPTFRRGYLDKVLGEEGIFYYNLTQIGAPKSIRNLINTAGYSVFFEEYRKHLYSNMKYFELLTKLINNGSTLLLCYEKDWNICHRKIIAEELEKRGYKVVHLA